LWHAREGRERHAEFWWGKLEDTDCLEDFDAGRRIILNKF